MQPINPFGARYHVYLQQHIRDICIMIVSMDQCHIHICCSTVALTSDVTYVGALGLKGLSVSKRNLWKSCWLKPVNPLSAKPIFGRKKKVFFLEIL